MIIPVELKKEMLKAARNYLAYKLGIVDTRPVLSENPVYEEKTGIFVTLNKNSNLRGCIGHIVGYLPLKESLFEMAEAAAFSDPRFPPLQKDELKDITLEISILSDLLPVDSMEKIIPGKHGVVLKHGYHQAVFLPQVATEQGWDRDEMLANLSLKAGLHPSAYKEKNTEFYVFTADVFSEKDYYE
ncbi:MAG: AmmeMemoRadiSam system protein A [Candidatus Marinimicrobia bacterium]|nr:AmmeMemoRadiSam system protein A [Candidatus Neomarinimicrobiota bacterium]MDD5581973.1 AmmeMemoRadiSam system protein A [Candidatus Neomarinimicrobiota bacterium]